MTMSQRVRLAAILSALSLTNTSLGADISTLQRQIEELRSSNQQLQQQLEQQQSQLSILSSKLAELEHKAAAAEPEADAPPLTRSIPSSRGLSIGKAVLSGEGGIGFFSTGSDGQFPYREFRVDEARLFLDAPIWGDVFLFAELNLITRETNEEMLKLGELFLDFENLSQWWGADRLLNLRVGRFDIPFGEEYQPQST